MSQKKYKNTIIKFIILLLISIQFSCLNVNAIGRTEIDVQNIIAGGDVDCVHIYEAKWDSENHWYECWKCGHQKAKERHNLVIDSGLVNQCVEQAPQIYQKCYGLDGKCQHQKLEPKLPHTWPDNISGTDYALGIHHKDCKVCDDWIWQEGCEDSDGRLGCGNEGYCKVCGGKYGVEHRTLTTNPTDWEPVTNNWKFDETYRKQTQELNCSACGNTFGTMVIEQYKVTSNVEGRALNLRFNINLKDDKESKVAINFGNGYQPWDKYGPRLLGGGYTSLVNGNTYQLQNDFLAERLAQNIYDPQTNRRLGDAELWKSGSFALEYYNQASLWEAVQNRETLSIQPMGTGLRWFSGWSLNGQVQQGYVQIDWSQFPDMTAPYYQSSQTDLDGILNVDGVNWWNKATVGVKQYDTFISPGMLETDASIIFYDKDKKPITDWVPMIKDGFNGSYQQFYKALDIVDEIRGEQPIYIECKDKTGNISNTVEIKVQNIDTLAPRITNEAQLETTQEWSKYKDIDYLFKDLGVGKVKVQFNSASDTLLPGEQDYYQYANNIGNDTYKRPYRFTGNVQGKTGATIYVKDELGNVTQYRVNIYNLDNTAPTIVQCNSSRENDTKKTYINITSEHDNFQNGKPGQGIEYHMVKFIKQPISQKPANPQKPQQYDSNWSVGKRIQVRESGWYFVYAKDKVGNVSEPYAIYVDASTITYHANGGHLTQNIGIFTLTDDLETFGVHILRDGTEFKRDGYKIRSWNTSPYGTGTRYELGEHVRLTESTTLYADWARVYTLQLDLKGGRGEYWDADTYVGTNPAYLIAETFSKNIRNPFKTGYNFWGWQIKDS